jgi:hypothetical protein
MRRPRCSVHYYDGYTVTSITDDHRAHVEIIEKEIARLWLMLAEPRPGRGERAPSHHLQPCLPVIAIRPGAINVVLGSRCGTVSQVSVIQITLAPETVTSAAILSILLQSIRR